MVRVESTLDSNVTKEVNKQQLKKLSFIMIIFSLVFILLGFLMISNGGELSIGIIFIVLEILYIPLVIWLTKFFQKRLDKSMSIMSSETKCSYIFTDEEITIDGNKNDEYSCVIKAKYSYHIK